MTNKMKLFWFIYLLLISSKCFGRFLRPSSGALDCICSFNTQFHLIHDTSWQKYRWRNQKL